MNINLLLISSLLSIMAPLIMAIFVRRRMRPPWLYFLVGVGTFLGSQLVRIPLVEFLSRLGLLTEIDNDGFELIRTAVIIGLAAAVTEELARVIGFLILKNARKAGDAIMAGLGHGGLESMIFGGVFTAASASVLQYNVAEAEWASRLSPELLILLRQQLAFLDLYPLIGTAPLAERLLSIAIHLSLSIIIFKSVRERNWRYFIMAIIYHTAIDATAVIGARELDNPWTVEALLLVVSLPLFIFACRSAQLELRQSMISRGKSSGWTQFTASLKKEFKYQLKTWRMLIVVAVFLVFGMVSPLLAKYLPSLMSSIEGAEQFADLIPEPTIQDAVDQYVRNLTQFGFILAIILGMGAIAGEKEKGTAAMVLSKPLPIWAYTLSKFISQTLVYVIAFVLAAMTAAAYSSVLFEGLDLASFIFLNLLMLLWLIVFSSLTLLGSAVAPSTAAAGGVAAVLTITILIMGAVPGWGSYLPAGLVSWGTSLTAGIAVSPNYGAVAASLVLIILANVAALASLERQEI